MGRAERITELEQSLAEAQFTVQSLQEECAEYKKTIASFPGVKADFDDKLRKLQESHQKEVSDLKNLLKTTETSVNRRVTEALASIGVAQFATEEILSVSGKSPNALYQKFLSLKGAEQTKFYQEHEKEISSFLNAK